MDYLKFQPTVYCFAQWKQETCLIRLKIYLCLQRRMPMLCLLGLNPSGYASLYQAYPFLV